jgi:hypothetical protein
MAAVECCTSAAVECCTTAAVTVASGSFLTSSHSCGAVTQTKLPQLRQVSMVVLLRKHDAYRSLCGRPSGLVVVMFLGFFVT